MPGEGDADRSVERADVDSELERVGRDDAEQLAVDQPAFDLVALGGGVAAAIGRETLGELGGKAVGGHPQNQLDALARLHEADRPGAGADELGEQLGGFGQWRAPDAERLVEQRRVPDHRAT